MDAPAVRIGILAFPGMLQMDLTGPYGVFAAAPGAVVDLLWKDTLPVLSGDKLLVAPNLSFAACPATTHWQSLDLLAEFGAIPVRERVVADGNRITAAGVSAGIDMALTLVGREWGVDAACEIELAMEYDPHPPFGVGHPSLASKDLVDRLCARTADRQKLRADAVHKAALRLREACGPSKPEPSCS